MSGRHVEDGPAPAVPHLGRAVPHDVRQVDQGEGGAEAVGGHLCSSEVSQSAGRVMGVELTLT